MFLKLTLLTYTSNLVIKLKCSNECESIYGKKYSIGDMWKGHEHEDDDCFICRCNSYGERSCISGIECLQSKCDMKTDYDLCCEKHKCVGFYNNNRKNKGTQ